VELHFTFRFSQKNERNHTNQPKPVVGVGVVVANWEMGEGGSQINSQSQQNQQNWYQSPYSLLSFPVSHSRKSHFSLAPTKKTNKSSPPLPPPIKKDGWIENENSNWETRMDPHTMNE
jgi:hypothetical protein